MGYRERLRAIIDGFAGLRRPHARAGTDALAGTGDEPLSRGAKRGGVRRP